SFTNPGEERPVPTHAQTAVAEASGVAENIVRSIKKEPLKVFRYRHKGDLVSLGRWGAVGEIAGIAFSGRFAWWLWRTVYLSKLLSWQKKVRVAVDWTINICGKRDISELP
ncbi:MAG: copper transporter, partial [Parcubacteria group bacterium]|nr:copper transporter [Parcubacteria group bacterium]